MTNTPIEQLWRQLRRSDPTAVARRAMAAYDLSEGAYELPFVGRPARLWPKEAAAAWTDLDPPEALKPLHLRIALSYLLTASPIELEPLHWEPAAALPAEARRALDAAFGRDATSLIRAARKLGGHRSQAAEQAAELALLPRVHLRVVFRETADAGARENVLEWNRGAGDQLPQGLAAALLDMAVTRLIAAAQ